MAHSSKAPKQWPLQSDATITQFEQWKNNLIFTLSLDKLNSQFLQADATWTKETRTRPNRGLTDDPETVAEAIRMTAVQKVNALQIMLGQIANYAPLNRATITKQSTSLKEVWKAIRLHLGFQANGARVLDLADMSLKPGERPEDLYQRLLAFMDDNLMKADGGIKHNNADITEDEELTPSLENIIVVTWLNLLHKDMPKLVKQRYSTQLRLQSLVSIKNEISGALDSLLEEIQGNQDSKVMRSVIRPRETSNSYRFDRNNRDRDRDRDRKPPRSIKECPLCKEGGRSAKDHYLADCRFLPEKDRRYISNLKARSGQVDSDNEDEEEPDIHNLLHDNSNVRSIGTVEENFDVRLTARRVPVIPSPFIICHYKHHTVRVTVDSGATGNFIRLNIAQRLNANIRKNTQKSNLADGQSLLDIVGEMSINLSFKGHNLLLEALVASKLDEDILAGTPFMDSNDVWVRPRKKIVGIGDAVYQYKTCQSTSLTNRSVQVDLLRSPSGTTVWPGDYLEIQVPDQYVDSEIGIEPRFDCPLNSNCSSSDVWPSPQVIACSNNIIRIPNLSTMPKKLRKNEHFCQIRQISTSVPPSAGDIAASKSASSIDNPSAFLAVSIDPDNITPPDYKQRLESITESYSHTFNPKFPKYNGRDGAVKAVVNMGPVQPPQRKGRLPLYNRDKLDILQQKFDELESLGVFAKPEDVGVVVEYLNPSFLVSKTRGGHRLVTDFGEVARYAKPQPSLLPDMDSTLRTIAQWNHIICTDLCKAYFQIPLDPASMKYCGVSTPYKGTRVYITAAMGQPGSETVLEELTCRVFGSLIQDRCVAKIADNLYCGGTTLDDLCHNWERLLKAASRNDLRLSASQTVVNPKTTSILGWVWSQGTIKASPHSICTLQSCELPSTVSKLRSFVGAYKVLSRVLPGCAAMVSPFDSMTGSRPSAEKLQWSDESLIAFEKAQKYLSQACTITMPRKSDHLWIVMDATTKIPAVGATLYVGRDLHTFKIGGFFSAKMQSYQIDWLPCEREALGIASSIKYFQPFITQSDHQSVVLTDNKPCVQAFAKL